MIVKNITSDSLTILAPAKINLFLEVLRKREDQFHEINSVFQAVSLFDKLEICKSEQSGCHLKIKNKPDLPVDKTNLVVKAFNLINSTFSLPGGLKIVLEKNIPIAAGLGGGSADAAAVIRACNLLYNLSLNRNEESELGAEIGSDIPFFFGSGQALVKGRGEIIEDITLPTNYYLLLVNPNCPVSTAEAYGSLKRGLTNYKIPFNLGECRTYLGLVDRLRLSGNDFEEVHLRFFSELGKIRDGFLQLGSDLARMSGSGPTVFAMFTRKPDRESVEQMNQDDWLIFEAEPLRFNPG